MMELDLLNCLPRPGLRPRRGQTLVEYMLMLAVVVGVALMLGIAFHRKFLGGFFTLIGMVIGGGTPS
ncbi:MAG TPA: class III signal peptide-containing protein [Elusimicrobiales bacterium]|nr:class III signal peptide-containing protein [Elusimicrobiales bacterium]